MKNDIDRMIRVDQAGEFGATRIYAGQLAVMGDRGPHSGEIAAMAVLDGVARLLPGVVGSAASLDEESFSGGLLEYPHFTRPRDWEGRAVPEVLLSGHHGQIAAWRRSEAERATRLRRPDLWSAHRGGARGGAVRN